MHAHTNGHYIVHNLWHIPIRDHRRRGSFKSNSNRVTSGHIESQVLVILEGNIQLVHMEGCLYDGPGCSTSSYLCPWIIPSPERDWAKWFNSIEENMAKVMCWHFQNYIIIRLPGLLALLYSLALWWASCQMVSFPKEKPMGQDLKEASGQ